MKITNFCQNTKKLISNTYGPFLRKCEMFWNYFYLFILFNGASWELTIDFVYFGSVCSCFCLFIIF